MEPEEVKSILNNLLGDQKELQGLIEQAVAGAEKITEHPVSDSLS